MGYHWQRIADEIRENAADVNICSPMAIDSLWGTIRSLRWRGMAGMDKTLSQALAEDRARVIKLTTDRLELLDSAPNITFRRRRIPRCSLGFGTFGWKYDPAIIRQAVAYGCLIDTAEGYGFGRVETALGTALKGLPQAWVTTKVRRDHMSPQSIANARQRSENKLGLPFSYQLHYPHIQYPDAVLQLAEFYRDGLIRGIGIGNCSVDQIEYAQRILTEQFGQPLHSVQVPFNLLNQRVADTVIPYCQSRGICVLAYSPLGQSFKQLHRPILDWMAKKYSTTPSVIALAWILDKSGVMPIPRTNNLQHLHQNVEAYQCHLAPEDVEELQNEMRLPKRN